MLGGGVLAQPWLGGFRFTNDQLADERYITLGRGADLGCVPLRGVILVADAGVHVR